MSNRMILTSAAVVTGLALSLAPAVAMAASPAGTGSVTVSAAHTSTLGSIATPTATVVNHPPYGKVYQLRGSVSGTQSGDWVRILDANNQRVPGFKAFQLANPISTYTVYFTPGSTGGTYKVQIGNQTSAGVYLSPLTATRSSESPTGGA